MLQDAGIYLIADLGQPSLSINRDTPAWNEQLYSRYTSVIDSLHNYTNVLGFFAGNEVSNNATNTNASAFVKAAVRDMKAYMKRNNYRTIGVGYATNDDASIRENLAAYFNCGPADSSIDFWGYNIYSWCGDSSYQKSGYDTRTEAFSNYSVPTFFAEYGCNTVPPRSFSEVQALYGKQMTPVWSGGIVYMYFQEANNYGETYPVDKASAGDGLTFSQVSYRSTATLPASSQISPLCQAKLPRSPRAGSTPRLTPQQTPKRKTALRPARRGKPLRRFHPHPTRSCVAVW